MTASETIANFEVLYLHDSMMTSFEVFTAEARCRLKLHAGAVLRAKGGNKFDPSVRYEPAVLTIEGVREMAFEGRFQLNATIVEADVRALPDGEHVEYAFTLTGGSDPDAFMVTLRIIGKEFSFGSR